MSNLSLATSRKARPERAPIRVMLVDDHKTVLWGLQRLIESAQPKMEVAAVANTAHDMLEMAGQVECDVILVDLDLAGHDAAAELPKLAQRTNAHALVLTSERSPTVHEAAILRGARGVVCKDEAPETLLRAIERVSAGEVWINRDMMGRVLGTLAAGQSKKEHDPEATKIAGLTPRERQIIAAVVRQRGAKSLSIADDLHICENTLRNHLTAIYAKLGLHSRIELFVYANEHGLSDGTRAAA